MISQTEAWRRLLCCFTSSSWCLNKSLPAYEVSFFFMNIIRGWRGDYVAFTEREKCHVTGKVRINRRQDSTVSNHHHSSSVRILLQMQSICLAIMSMMQGDTLCSLLACITLNCWVMENLINLLFLTHFKLTNTHNRLFLFPVLLNLQRSVTATALSITVYVYVCDC